MECINVSWINYKKKKYKKHLNIVLDGQTTSGYSEGISKLKSNEGKYCIDMYWKKLQDERWYIVNPKFGKQRESFSDIQCKITNYNL